MSVKRSNTQKSMENYTMGPKDPKQRTLDLLGSFVSETPSKPQIVSPQYSRFPRLFRVLCRQGVIFESLEITSWIKGKFQLVLFISDFILDPTWPSFLFYPPGGPGPCISGQRTKGPPPFGWLFYQTKFVAIPPLFWFWLAAEWTLGRPLTYPVRPHA